MDIKWIKYKGQSILESDLRNLDENSVAVAIDLILEIVQQAPKKSVLFLTDITGTKNTPKIIGKVLMSIGKLDHALKASALLGIKGEKECFMELLFPYSHIFKTKKQAKEWLSGQECSKFITKFKKRSHNEDGALDDKWKTCMIGEKIGEKIKKTISSKSSKKAKK